jgi:H+-transporting ATPase
MAEEKAVGAPALDTNIETGGFDEKRGQAPPATHNPKAPVADDEEPDEDMDALIEDLESEDGHEIDDEEEATPGGGRVVPEDQLQTDSRVGLTEAEVIARRKKWGLNAMKEERENMILKFLMFFVGPIQFVMASFILLSLALLFSHVSKLCDFPSIFHTHMKFIRVSWENGEAIATYKICPHGPWF